MSQGDLSSYLHYQGKDWKQANDPRLLPITLEQYYDTFCSDGGQFNPENFSIFNEESRNVSGTKWSNGQMVLQATVKVNGVPFIDEASSTGTYTLAEKSDSRVVIELTTETKDTPYSSTFVAHEVWVAVSSEENKVWFQRFMRIEMREWSWYERYIIMAAEKNIVDNDKIWYDMASEKGFFEPAKIKQEEYLPEKTKEDQATEPETKEKEEAPQPALPQVEEPDLNLNFNSTSIPQTIPANPHHFRSIEEDIIVSI